MPSLFRDDARLPLRVDALQPDAVQYDLGSLFVMLSSQDRQSSDATLRQIA